MAREYNDNPNQFKRWTLDGARKALDRMSRGLTKTDDLMETDNPAKTDNLAKADNSGKTDNLTKTFNSAKIDNPVKTDNPTTHIRTINRPSTDVAIPSFKRYVTLHVAKVVRQSSILCETTLLC